MKRMLFLFSLALISVFLVTSCGSKKVQEVKGFTKYTDEVTKFSFKYPQNWYLSRQIGGEDMLIFSSKETIDRFRKYAPEGLTGAKIEVMASKLSDSVTIDTLIKKSKIFVPETYTNPEKVKVAGLDATKITYIFPLNDGNFKGEMYFLTKDGKMATIVTFECFGSTFDDYKKAAFDEVLNSIVPAEAPAEIQPKTVQTEAPFPSQTLKAIKGEGYSIQIPDNFNTERVKGIKDAIYSIMYIGERRGDDYITIVVKDASKQKDLAKIVNETVKGIAGASAPSSTSFAGEKAMMTNYNVKTSEGTVKSKLFFLLRNNKLYQVGLTWNSTKEEKEFLPILEKSINTFKLQ